MKRQIPEGLRDLLPEEVKKQTKIIAKIRQVFEQNRYERIITPTFEYYEALEPGLPKDLKEQAYRFLDDDGNVMILRVDHTTPIARVVSTSLDTKKPLRLYYSGDVFRKTKITLGQDNQFHQIGAELIGVPGTKGDKEVLALVKKVLTAVGLKNYSIDCASAEKISKLPPAKQKALAKKDFVAYGRLPQKDELLASNHDYYTGLIFEIAVPELGYSIGNGGRYNGLFEKFGEKRSAVGFAISLGRLICALEKQGTLK